MKSVTPTRKSTAAVRPARAAEDRHFVTALARGLDVLAAFRTRDRMLGNQELARRCGLPKSTISRLTYTLTRQGYLEATTDGLGHSGYRLGSAVLALGGAMLARMDVRALARPLMQDLADSTQTMVSLGMRDRLSMIYIENCRSEAALTLSLDVGSRIPLASTAMGRAYLTACGESERDDLLQRIRSQDEKAWPRHRAGLEQARKDLVEYGCCVSFGDWQKQVHAIAAAIQPAGGGALMVINCGGPAVSLSREFLLDEVRPRLLALVRKLQGAAAPV